MKGKLSGGVLMYVLLLVMLVSSTLLMAIWAFGLGKQTQMHLFHQSLARDNLLSGVTYYTHAIQGGVWQDVLYQESADSIRIADIPWGLWNVLKIRTQHEQARDSIALLAGSALQQAYALYLANLGQPLMVGGNTRLSGQAKLPPQGVRPTRVDNAGFIGTNGFMEMAPRSGKNLPRLDIPNLESLTQMIRGMLTNPTELTESHYDFPLEQSWLDPLRIEQTNGSIVIDEGARMSGQVLLIAREEITVEPEAELSHVILMAPRIHIRSGFKGKLQAVASSSIEIDSMVQLSYPSALCLLPQDELPSLRIGHHSRVEGTLLMLPLELEKPEFGSAYIGESTRIIGWSHLDGTVDFRGHHTGELAVKSFSYDGRGRVYRNTLAGAIIERAGLSPEFGGPIRGKSTGPWQIIEWLP